MPRSYAALCARCSQWLGLSFLWSSWKGHRSLGPGRWTGDVPVGEVLEQEPVDEDVTAAGPAQEQPLGRLVKEADITQRGEAVKGEQPAQDKMLQAHLPTKTQAKAHPADHPADLPDDQPDISADIRLAGHPKRVQPEEQAEQQPDTQPDGQPEDKSMAG